MEIKEKRKFKNKWEEFKYGEWRKPRPSVYVTLETEIPEMPEVTLEKPDEKELQQKLKNLESKISDIGKSLEAKKSTFEDLIAVKKNEGAPTQTREIGLKLKKV